MYRFKLNFFGPKLYYIGRVVETKSGSEDSDLWTPLLPHIHMHVRYFQLKIKT